MLNSSLPPLPWRARCRRQELLGYGVGLRYLARAPVPAAAGAELAPALLYGGGDVLADAEADQWLDYAPSVAAGAGFAAACEVGGRAGRRRALPFFLSASESLGHLVAAKGAWEFLDGPCPRACSPLPTALPAARSTSPPKRPPPRTPHTPHAHARSRTRTRTQFVDGYLSMRTYLAGHALSVADVAVWAGIAGARGGI